MKIANTVLKDLTYNIILKEATRVHLYAQDFSMDMGMLVKVSIPTEYILM